MKKENRGGVKRIQETGEESAACNSSPAVLSFLSQVSLACLGVGSSLLLHARVLERCILQSRSRWGCRGWVRITACVHWAKAHRNLSGNSRWLKDVTSLLSASNSIYKTPKSLLNICAVGFHRATTRSQTHGD